MQQGNISMALVSALIKFVDNRNHVGYTAAVCHIPFNRTKHSQLPAVYFQPVKPNRPSGSLGTREL